MPAPVHCCLPQCGAAPADDEGPRPPTTAGARAGGRYLYLTFRRKARSGA